MSCETSNAPARRFCRECGSTLGAACERCAFVNDAEDRFCGGCGHASAAAQSNHRRDEAVVSSLQSPSSRPPPLRSTVKAVKRHHTELSVADVLELLTPLAPSEPRRPGKISQTELDRLFGAK